MIAHAEHHAARPLPSGVSLAALLCPPTVIEPHRPRKVSPMAADDVFRTYERCKTSREQFVNNAAAKRLETYRPVMIGQGWMSAAEVADETGIMVDSVRQRLGMLVESGEVESRKNSDNSRQWRWKVLPSNVEVSGLPPTKD